VLVVMGAIFNIEPICFTDFMKNKMAIL